MVSTKLQLGFLEDAWDAAPDGDGGLRQQLRDFEKAVLKVLSGGAISSVSGNGSSHTYSTNGLQQEDVAQMWRDLILLHDKISAQLGDGSNSDQAIYTEMVALLSAGGVTEWESDFSGVCR